MKKTIQVVIAFAAIIGSASAAPGDKPSKNLSATVTFLSTSYNKGDYTAIAKRFTGLLATSWPPEKAKPFFSNIAQGVGKIKAWKLKSVVSPDHATYIATCDRDSLLIEIEVDAKSRIDLLGIRPGPKGR